MKTFETFNQPDGWNSAAAAFAEDFRHGHRVQAAPWGGYAILGHAELMELARNPLADGMAPDAGAMAETPAVFELLVRALFTKSGAVHRAERSAVIAALNRVSLAEVVASATLPLKARGEARLDLRADIVAPVVRTTWAALIGLGDDGASALEQAVHELGYVISPAPDPTRAALAQDAAHRVRDLSRAALAGPSAFTAHLRHAVGDDIAIDLIGGMAFDAIESATTGIDAALRVALRHPALVRPTAACAGECLRLASSTPMTMRLTTGPVQLSDLAIEPGTVLSMIWAAGNHDPAAFADPARFDPERTGSRPLMFGGGQHACLGHAIVRTILVDLLGVVGRIGLEPGTGGARWAPFSRDYLPPLAVAWR